MDPLPTEKPLEVELSEYEFQVDEMMEVAKQFYKKLVSNFR